MRILCLHGYGSNSNVNIQCSFAAKALQLTIVTKSQAASLKRELRRVMGDGAQLDFICLQGCIESSPYPGLDQIYSAPFYKFWDTSSTSSVLAAIELVASSISTNDPDVIFAHSDGGAVALSALLRCSHNVKCLVLASPWPPFDPSGHRRLDVSISGTPIKIPTLFIRGERDPLAHFVALAEGLVDERYLTIYSWNGGHEVPNSSEGVMWAGIAQKLMEILDSK